MRVAITDAGIPEDARVHLIGHAFASLIARTLRDKAGEKKKPARKPAFLQGALN